MPSGYKNKSQKVALCGVMGALAAVCMTLGGFIPLATFVAPGIAGMLVLIAAIEFGYHTGFLLYLVIALLSLVFCPDKEMSCIFLFLLGYYPLLKAKLDEIKSKPLCIFLKFLLFNVSVISMYGILTFIFPIPALREDFAETGTFMLIFLLFAGNITFFIYDLAIQKIVWLYLHKYRSRILKGKK